MNYSEEVKMVQEHKFLDARKVNTHLKYMVNTVKLTRAADNDAPVLLTKLPEAACIVPDQCFAVYQGNVAAVELKLYAVNESSLAYQESEQLLSFTSVGGASNNREMMLPEVQGMYQEDGSIDLSAIIAPVAVDPATNTQKATQSMVVVPNIPAGQSAEFLVDIAIALSVSS